LKIQKIKEKLRSNINEINNCKEKDCNIDKIDINSIFSPEKDGIINENLKRKLLDNTGNYKACDCIILCKDGYIYIVEILCGKLTKKEVNDKLKQVKNCKKLLDYLNLIAFIKISYILYKSKNFITRNDEKLFKKKALSVQQNENVYFKQIKKGKGFKVCNS